MEKPKFGPSYWSGPATAGVYRYSLLPALTLLPLLGLYVQGNWSNETAALSCVTSLTLYKSLPYTLALNKNNFLREYWGYRNTIEARLRQADVSPAEERYLRRRLIKLESQYHLVLNPKPTLELANALASAAWLLARTFARH